MTGQELLERLTALTPEQRQLPVVYDYYTYGDEMEGDHCGDINSAVVKRAHYGLPEAIHLADHKE